MRTVLVVTPTYNEAENIRAIVDAVFKVGERLSVSYELHMLVVDDSSPDGTGKLVAAMRKHNSRLHLLKGQKAGLGNAYIRGFRHGLRLLDPWAIVMMDADMSHDPASIPALLGTLESGADYAIGSRYVHGGTIPGNWPLLRILNSRIANALARTLTGIPKAINDITGGYKAIRGAALKQIELASINATGYVFQVSLLHSFLQQGFVVNEVPITFVDRRYGVSKLKLKDILEFIYRAYRLNPDSGCRRAIRFLTVGASGSLINVLALFVMVHYLHVPVTTAAAMAIELSIISNFVLNDSYTFKSTPETPALVLDGFYESLSTALVTPRSNLAIRFIRFNLGALVGAAIALGILTLLNSRFGVNYIVADLVAILMATGWNYWISTRLVWRTSNA